MREAVHRMEGFKPQRPSLNHTCTIGCVGIVIAHAAMPAVHSPPA